MCFRPIAATEKDEARTVAASRRDEAGIVEIRRYDRAHLSSRAIDNLNVARGMEPYGRSVNRVMPDFDEPA